MPTQPSHVSLSRAANAARLALVGCVGLAVLSGGCRWRQLAPQAGMNPTPIVFSRPPNREEVIQVVEGRTSRIRRLQTSSARLGVGMLPAIRADLAYEQNLRFRLRAESGITGPEVDLGSNDDHFWFWARRNSPPAVYYARHVELANSPVARMIPIQPQWVTEAIGLVRFDPRDRHEGPFPRQPGQIEMRSSSQTPAGEVTRVLVLDDQYGYVLEQHLYEAGGRLMASVRASEHRYYPVDQVALPGRLEFDLPAAGGMRFRLEVDDYLVNNLYGDPNQLFAMPQYSEYPLVNLADPRLMGGPTAQVQPQPSGESAFSRSPISQSAGGGFEPTATAPNYAPNYHPAHEAHRPRVRGYSR